MSNATFTVILDPIAQKDLKAFKHNREEVRAAKRQASSPCKTARSRMPEDA